MAVKPKRQGGGEPTHWKVLPVPLFPDMWFNMVATPLGWQQMHKHYNFDPIPNWPGDFGGRLNYIKSTTTSAKGWVMIINVELMQEAKHPVANLASFVAHEASHMVDDIFEEIGESHPGTETRSYLLDWAVAQAMIFYTDRFDFPTHNDKGRTR